MAFRSDIAARLEARCCVEGSIEGAKAASAGDMRHDGIGVDSDGKKAGGKGSPFVWRLAKWSAYCLNVEYGIDTWTPLKTGVARSVHCLFCF